jgi:hypothetical protein
VGFSWERCFDASLEGLAHHHYFGKVPPAISRVAPGLKTCNGRNGDLKKGTLKMDYFHN